MDDGAVLPRLELAGAGARFGALAIDAVVLYLISVPVVGLAHMRPSLAMLLVLFVVWGVYYVLFESSPLRATPGKLATGIRVVDTSGRRLSIGKAALRYAGKWLALAGAFFLRGGVVRRGTRQGMHDMMAGSLVVRKAR